MERLNAAIEVAAQARAANVTVDFGDMLIAVKGLMGAPYQYHFDFNLFWRLFNDAIDGFAMRAAAIKAEQAG